MLNQKTFFLEGADGLCADFEPDFFAVYFDGFGLEVGFPDFFGVALRKADVAAVLLAFAGKITFLHSFS